MNETRDNNIGKSAALLVGCEVGLGSLLHSFKVPLSGQLLSINQNLILSRTIALNKNETGMRFSPISVSNVAAILKSLSPAGKKLTPMLAISAQGILFGFGTMIFGANIIGACVGSLLSSLWAFVQPLILYYLFYGTVILNVGHFYYTKLHEALAFQKKDLFIVLFILVALKMCLSLAATIAAFFMPLHVFENYAARLKAAVKNPKSIKIKTEFNVESTQPRHVIKQAFKDLLSPLFIISILLTGFFCIYSETSWAQTIWICLRPAALGFILYYIIRRISFERLLVYLEKKGFKVFVKSFRFALDSLKKS